MQIEAIKKGRWYETTIGLGQCLGIFRTFRNPRPRVAIDIVGPTPLGKRYLTTKDVLREISAPPV